MIIQMKIYRPQTLKAINLVKSEVSNKIKGESRKNKYNTWLDEQKKSVEYFTDLDILTPEVK